MSFSVAFRRWFAVGLLCLGASLAFASPIHAQIRPRGDEGERPTTNVQEAQQRGQALEEEARAASQATSSNLTPFTPQLSVPIPGIQFTTPTMEGNFVSVPFLAQYITGIYRYVLGISTIFGIIAVIVGGFYYLVGETVGDANRGKSIIQDALFGLIILYSASFILTFVNPGLTSLRPLSLMSVDANDFDIDPLRPTVPDGEIQPAPSSRSGGGTRNGLAEGGGSNARFSQECPLTNLPTEPAARREAFATGIGTHIRSTERLARVAEVANFAANCNIYYGSCRAHAQGYREVATGGVFDTGRYENSTFVRSIRGISCPAAGAGCPTVPGCTTDGAAARARVRALRGDQEQNRLADMLAPGDWLWIYNGNSGDCAGQHSIVFIGWDGDSARGRAHVVEGWQGHPSRHASYCLRPACGNYFPITRIR